jgi:hypothetical protein
MFIVKEIHVAEDKSLTVLQEEEYERENQEKVTGEKVVFKPSGGTVKIYLNDGTIYTSYPEAFEKITTSNQYLDSTSYPNRVQTRDFWIEEAQNLTFSKEDERTSEYSGYIKMTGMLSNGEPVSKFFPVTGNKMRILTVEKGIIPLKEYLIDHIEVDLSETPDFSKIKIGRISLTDGTVYELPVTAIEYNHPVGGGVILPHPEYDYFFYTGSAEWDINTGYSEDEKELLFNAFTEIDFSSEDNLGEREFPATVIFKDGHIEELNFRFYNYYGNSLDFYCPNRMSIRLSRSDFSLSKLEM